MSLFKRAPVFAKYGMACASTPIAAVVGRDVLKAGGNATDAALAMAVVVGVAEPMMNGLGGDSLRTRRSRSPSAAWEPTCSRKGKRRSCSTSSTGAWTSNRRWMRRACAPLTPAAFSSSGTPTRPSRGSLRRAAIVS